MSNIRTQFTHKSVMLVFLFLGILISSIYEKWSLSDAVADQAETPSIEAEAEQPLQNESLEASYEQDETSIAGLG